MSATVRAGALLLLVTACGGRRSGRPNRHDRYVERAAAFRAAGRHDARQRYDRDVAGSTGIRRDRELTRQPCAARQGRRDWDGFEDDQPQGRRDQAGAAESREPEPGASDCYDTGYGETGYGEAEYSRPGYREGRPRPSRRPAAPAGGGPTSPQLVALGDSIFHGHVAGGTCTACHGQDAKGTAVAPDLTDNQWINGDGATTSSYTR